MLETITWSNQRIRSHIWISLVEYGKVEWGKTKRKVAKAKTPEKVESDLMAFDATWAENCLFCISIGLLVSWKHFPRDVPIISS